LSAKIHVLKEFNQDLVKYYHLDIIMTPVRDSVKFLLGVVVSQMATISTLSNNVIAFVVLGKEIFALNQRRSNLAEKLLIVTSSTLSPETVNCSLGVDVSKIETILRHLRLAKLPVS
jgi:hypothetical protein